MNKNSGQISDHPLDRRGSEPHVIPGAHQSSKVQNPVMQIKSMSMSMERRTHPHQGAKLRGGSWASMDAADLNWMTVHSRDVAWFDHVKQGQPTSCSLALPELGTTRCIANVSSNHAVVFALQCCHAAVAGSCGRIRNIDRWKRPAFTSQESMSMMQSW
ncbi:hypothetical protein VTI74DRAFT_1831 [Chaetomium olivicolor]